MRARRPSPDEVAETTRRRLALLTAELARLREETANRAPRTAARASSDLVPDSAVGAASPELDGAATPPGPGLGPVAAAAPQPASGTVAVRGRHARRPVGLPGRVGSWLHDRLPPTLQGRLGLSPGNVSVVMLLVAVGFAVTAWWVLRADGGTPVAPRAEWAELSEPAAVTGPVAGLVEGATVEGAAVEGAAGTGAELAEADAGTVVVDVTGRVRRRGIVTLPLGSRVVDALEAAGGPRPGVDLSTLNLARVLVDGEQIVVGVPPPGGVAAPAASAAPTGAAATPLVNLNTAGPSELDALPGVGPVTAEAIISWRTEHGPFTAVDELLEVSGIGDARLADIAPFVTL